MISTRTVKPTLLPQAALLAVCASLLPQQASATGYAQENLVSNIPGLASNTDPNLINPWGIAMSATSPFWISDNGTGLTTLYNTTGVTQGLVVTIPPPPGSPGGTPSKPTGQVFSGSSTNFLLSGSTNPSRFIFATEDGTISGWNPSANPTNAIIKVDNSASGAIYKGLAINSAQDTLFAANFGGTGGLERYGSTFNSLGSFTDSNVPAGFAPFNAQNIGGTIYVTFAKQNGLGDDVPGLGNGFVDTFDPATNSFTRLISGGPLDSPWGIAKAPSTFGEFSNALLVGNFGDGKINAFDPITGSLLGSLTEGSGSPIVIDGLWALTFGNGGSGGLTNKLYFTAGLNGEADGLFGSLVAVPVPGAFWLFGSALAGLIGLRRKA